MRRNLGVAAWALVGVLAFGACAGKSDDAQSLGPVPTAPSTTVMATTTSPPTTAPPQATTTRPATTGAPTTALAPVLVDGVPQVKSTPTAATVGTVVRLDGTGFTDAMWRSGATLWLTGSTPGCALYAEAEHTLTVSSAGRLSGTFTIPATGTCRMSDLPARPVPAGNYRLAYSCTACFIGQFEVIVPQGTCADVAFAPNSDNLATNIVGTGVSCLDAEALVRKVGAQVRSVGGPSRVEVDGYVCVRTGERDGPGLPASDFECTNGSRKVTFHRL